MPLRQLPLKLPFVVDRRIDLATERVLGTAQSFDHCAERDVADYAHVDVAAAPVLTSGKRAVDEGPTQLRAEGFERRTKHVRQAGRLEEQRAQLGVDRAGRIGLIIHLMSASRAADNAGGGERAQLALHGARSGFGSTDELAQIKGFIRPA